MNCEQCKQEILGSFITVTIDCSSEIFGPDNKSHRNFCCWACVAVWCNVQAGEILMPDPGSEYWHEYITS
jgi:hypothetical protein